MQMPSATRPQRPARWFALAWLTGSIGSRCTLSRWLYREIRAVPGSTTYRMPGTVSDVSATLVASTIRRPGCGAKTRCCSAADSRAYSGSTSTGSTAEARCRRSASAVSRISRSPEKKTSTSPGPSTRSSSTASSTAWVWSRSSAAGSSGSDERPVAHLDRVGAPGHLDDRRVAEVLGEPFGVDGGRGDDELEVGPARQQLLEVAEQEVDVQAALVRLVDDDRVVALAGRGRAGSRPAGCRRSSAGPGCPRRPGR